MMGAMFGVIMGQAMPGMTLSCQINNFYQTVQHVSQIEYQYSCVPTPQQPVSFHVEYTPCFGNCDLQPNGMGFYTNGPSTIGCQLTSYSCMAYTQ